MPYGGVLCRVGGEGEGEERIQKAREAAESTWKEENGLRLFVVVWCVGKSLHPVAKCLVIRMNRCFRAELVMEYGSLAVMKGKQRLH